MPEEPQQPITSTGNEPSQLPSTGAVTDEGVLQAVPDISTEVEPTTAAPVAVNDGMTGQDVAVPPVMSSTPSIVNNPFPMGTPDEPIGSASASGGMPPSKSNKKIVVIGAIIAGALTLVGGSSALAYNVWYQNPDKVIADAIVNVVTGVNEDSSSVTELKLSGEGVSGVATLDTKTDGKLVVGSLKFNYDMTTPFKLTVKDASVNFAGSLDGDGYVKVNDADKLVDQIIDGLMSYSPAGSEAVTPQSSMDARKQAEDMYRSMIDPIVKKINNKWIKFPADTSKDENKEQKCVADTIKRVQDDKAMSKELVQVYKDNKFIVVKEKLQAKSGGLGYLLEIDSSKVKSFGEAAEETAFAKELKKCGGDAASDRLDSVAPSSEKEVDTFKDMRIEIWIDRWSHKLTGISVSGKASEPDASFIYSVDSAINYKKVGGLELPMEAINFDDIWNDAGQPVMNGSRGTLDSV